jgi:predicted  nucleic acid-binding Zn-ribbon protein
VLQQITNQLAKDKRTEQEVVAALGRAARMRQLTPPSCHDLVAASAQTEQGVAADQEKSVQQAEEARQADAAFQAASLKGQAQLDSLEQKLATAEAQAATTDQEVAQAEAKVAQLEAQEKEFSAAAGSGGKDATEQIRLYEGAKAQRKIAEMELKGLRDRQRAGQRPLNRLRGDIERVRGEVTKAQQRLDAAERGAEAAVLSQQRRTEMTRRNVAQFDEQIGRAVLALPKAPDSLKQLWASADVARRRVERGEDALRDQQGELDQYDSRRARIGLWLLVGVVLFSLAVLVAGGEIIRGLSGGEG